jgi:hypothetical protein
MVVGSTILNRMTKRVVAETPQIERQTQGYLIGGVYNNRSDYSTM